MKILETQDLGKASLHLVENPDGSKKYVVGWESSEFEMPYEEALYIFPTIAITVLDSFINKVPECAQIETEKILREKFLEFFNSRENY